MPIRPEDIDPSKLPVAFRGYDRAATDDLLKRVAWDYRQAARVQETWTDERERLKKQIAAAGGAGQLAAGRIHACAQRA